MNTPTLPYTITPHHMYGYDTRIWLVVEIIIAIVSGVLFLVIDELRPYWWAWLALPLGLVLLHSVFRLFSRGQSLTVTANGVEVTQKGIMTFIPYAKLDPVRRDVYYTGGRAFRALAISSAEMGVRFVPSTLNWGMRDFDQVYAAIPPQYRDDATDKRTRR